MLEVAVEVVALVAYVVSSLKGAGGEPLELGRIAPRILDT